MSKQTAALPGLCILLLDSCAAYSTCGASGDYFTEILRNIVCMCKHFLRHVSLQIKISSFLLWPEHKQSVKISTCDIFHAIFSYSYFFNVLHLDVVKR